MDAINPSNAAAIIAAVTGLAQVEKPFQLENGGFLYFHPEGMKAHIEEPLDKALPTRVTAHETVIEPASFIEYVNRFKTENTVCKARLSGGGSIEALLDYHGASTGGAAVNQALSHRVTLNCPHDVDYAVWKRKFGEAIPQADFAEFIEDMIHTIKRPAAAGFLDALRSISIDRDIKFKSVLNLANGTSKIAYSEDDVSNDVTLPADVVLWMSIYQGTDPIEIPAKLRYRLKDGAIKFVFVVPGLAKLEREQFRAIGDAILTATMTPVFYTA